MWSRYVTNGHGVTQREHDRFTINEHGLMSDKAGEKNMIFRGD